MTPFQKRLERADGWPIHFLHYMKGLWKIRGECDPPLTFLETLSLASKHTHNFIWGKIRYIELYLPKNRLRKKI